ncbi:Spy/CpxP family protein refolding chaperone [Pseudomonas sp. MH9.3]|uniref:Spy/CpxP family protein refolding chaperone n=1 Tax=Pseudomonas sp. MH9.3 TaxID=3048630 RepID=UPI002AC9E601|nr:Spy/CpxP family protein refolding chaperone [Pseudomonas sp. MH9.3]MEB0105283.1 Spy/CpxP family protein refolding chaperone [Pseudomonas sp. MH9.3]WPX81502.1 Spy/CpxP family protein refolding chaperone [Pseudomonas sp. MH9.3]
MRKTLIALMFATALPAVAMAAMPEGPGPGAGQMGGPEGHMMGGPGPGADHGPRGRGGPLRELDLTPEQHQQIGRLMREQMEGRRELVKKYLDKMPAADQKAMQDEKDASRKKTQSSIRAVLTPEQQKQFDEIVKKQDQRRAEWREFKAWKAQQPQKAQ